MSLVRDDSSRDFAPELLPGIPVDAEHDHLVARVGMLDPEDPLRLVLRFRQRRIDLAGVDCGREEHLVPPDDGATRAAAFDFGLPAEVLILAPLQWRLRRAGDAVILRAAPLVPIVGDRLGVGDGRRANRKGSENYSG